MAWTKEQDLAINSSGTNIIVSAGAGSGKTAVLTERVINKVKNGININRLLILTFTKAAALEMKERIRKKLKEAELYEQLDYIDSAYITTFDSFALSIVKKYHTELNVSSNTSIMDSSIEILKKNQIITDIFESMYDDGYFKKFIGDFCTKSDDIIKQVIINMSNKLDLLIDKDKYLDDYIDTHYSDHYIDSIINEYMNLINKSIENVKESYLSLKSCVNEKYMITFNLDPLLDSKNYDDIKSSIKLVGSPKKNNECMDDYIIYKDKIKKELNILTNLTRFENIEEIRNSYLSTKDYVYVIIQIIKKYNKIFNEYKKKNDIYTFTDIALMAISVIKENSYIRDEVMSSFDEIMVDEYQDTSDIQEEFINLISNNNVYMVGDIKQSIYRFRNANPYIFRNKYNEYAKNNGGIKIDLLKNFRSREEVIDSINLIFNLIMDLDVGDADYKNSHQMNFGNTNYKKLACEDNKTQILEYQYDNKEYSKDEVEAFIVAHDIKNKIDNKYKVIDKDTNELRNCTYSDFAIIMDRGTSFDLYKKIFEYNHIPLLQIKNERLNDGDDILILKNLIRFIVKVNNNEIDNELYYLFVSVSRSYLYKLDDEYIFDIVNSKLITETDLYKKSKSIEINEISSLDLINLIIDKFDYYNKIITTNNIKDSMIRIDYLKNLSVNLSNIGYTPIEFSKYLIDTKDINIEYSLNDSGIPAVKILNIHKSKGLEYNICYFAGLDKKANDEDKKSKFMIDSDNNIIVPYVNNGINDTILKDLLIAKESRDNVSERIRLFYVALTRAREKIIILLPKPINEYESYDIVDKSIRLNYTKISDMLYSIYNQLLPFIKKIDINSIGVNHEYENKLDITYKDLIPKSNENIELKENNIEYEIINQDKYSKNINKLIDIQEFKNLKEGIKFHYLFETEDFKTTKNPYVLKFLKHISLSYINEYKEYEFIYESSNEVKHGIIDLMLEYLDHIDIIDYKMQNIVDENYIKQLNGYKSYVETISEKKVNIYLYSILKDELKRL